MIAQPNRATRRKLEREVLQWYGSVTVRFGCAVRAAISRSIRSSGRQKRNIFRYTVGNAEKM